ncbi:beta-ketoacyl synthase N-terminal-like domain-containing protein [Streptomyces monticola]|uniref:Beta-ketoacyl synthase N-terminal-like domain-containing protein n=1 Tax=Streptomyces monticola TaxID=2666263 RepID=A0ABW2JAP3_9ACTN
MAIIGMAVLLPGAADLDAYWHNLVHGVDAISEAPEQRLAAHYFGPGAGPDRIHCRRGGFVDGIARFAPARFGVMPHSVADTEPDQLTALSVAAAALADAGGERRLPGRDRVGVVLGRGGYLTPGLARLDQRVRTAHQLTRTLRELLPGVGDAQLERIRAAFTERLGPEQPDAAIGLVPSLAASRLANRLDLRGPAYTVDAACASSLVAVDQAVAALASGRCDVMLAGGVHHCHDITLWSVFSRLRALSPSQRIRPFHAAADGILIGEGTGVVVLKRLDDAERDGDRVYAVIRGVGVAGDGRVASLVTPDPGGQARAVRMAWAAAGLDPREPGALGLLEAHGTGTPAGDSAELATLAEVFGPPDGGGTGGAGPGVIGSVKSMIGHTMPAAGVAGLVKAALAVHHGVLLPTLNCDEPHPALARTRFRPLAQAEPWPDVPVRRAAVNAFGFGGINAHAVIEQAPAAARRPAAALRVREPERALRLAAPTAARLRELLDADDTELTARAEPLPYAASGPPRPAAGGGTARLGVVAPTAKSLGLARRALADGRAWRGRGDVWFSAEPLLAPGTRGKVAFVFPGLEAEFAPHGLDEVADRFGLPLPAQLDAAVGDVARHAIGVLGAGGLLDAALRRLGVVPDAVAGHSVGEWAAMVAGGIYDSAAAGALLDAFDPDALRVPGLVFAMVGARADDVRKLLVELGDGRIVLSHDNAPHQSMVCGPERAVTEFAGELRARHRILAQILPFRSGFHTPMLAPYLGPLTAGAYRCEVRTPEVPVWSGTTAAPFPAGPDAVRALFVRHLLEPVRFRPLIEAMYTAGFRAFVQTGTGKLGSLISDTLNGRPHLTVAAHTARHPGLGQLARVATALWVEGRHDGAPPTTDHTVPLTLDTPLLSLPPATAAGLRSALGGRAPVAAAASGHGGPATGGALTADFRALLAESAAAAAQVAAAATATTAASPNTPSVSRTSPRTASRTASRIPHPGREARAMANIPAAAPAATIPAATATAVTTATATATITGAAPLTEPVPPMRRSTLRVSTRVMPYLLDHCFIPQPRGWPDTSDRRPVVPATTVVRHMADAAERAAPGQLAVAVRAVRLDAWVGAEPGHDVEITVEPAPDGRSANVAFGGYARAVVELADRHPEPPGRWWSAAAAERPCAHTAAALYRDRWMFHGPAFQGLTALTAIGDTHVRGRITVPTAPGALLDNVGQLLGYWVMATRTERTIVFPVRMEAFRFYGPEPPAGTELDCTVRITSLTSAGVRADAQLTLRDGTVWAEIDGWQDRRFAGLDARRTGGYPERRGLAEAQPGGWVLLQDDWPDLASRELVMRTYLSAVERQEYERRPPRGRRQWLLGRIAAKDAVRHRLWEQGAGEVFPAEILVRSDRAGRPYLTGLHGRALATLDLTIAHRGDAAVALVRPRPQGAPRPLRLGIDIEEITHRSEATFAVALGRAERALLAARCAATGWTPAQWFTRFWAAKEAVAKAEGTGLDGRPQEFEIAEADVYGLAVVTRGRRYPVRCMDVTTEPAGSSRRDYVVAWTTPENIPGTTPGTTPGTGAHTEERAQ